MAASMADGSWRPTRSTRRSNGKRPTPRWREPRPSRTQKAPPGGEGERPGGADASLQTPEGPPVGQQDQEEPPGLAQEAAGEQGALGPGEGEEPTPDVDPPSPHFSIPYGLDWAHHLKEAVRSLPGYRDRYVCLSEDGNRYFAWGGERGSLEQIPDRSDFPLRFARGPSPGEGPQNSEISIHYGLDWAHPLKEAVLCFPGHRYRYTCTSADGMF